MNTETGLDYEQTKKRYKDHHSDASKILECYESAKSGEAYDHKKFGKECKAMLMKTQPGKVCRNCFATCSWLFEEKKSKLPIYILIGVIAIILLVVLKMYCSRKSATI